MIASYVGMSLCSVTKGDFKGAAISILLAMINILIFLVKDNK